VSNGKTLRLRRGPEGDRAKLYMRTANAWYTVLTGRFLDEEEYNVLYCSGDPEALEAHQLAVKKLKELGR